MDVKQIRIKYVNDEGKINIIQNSTNDYVDTNTKNYCIHYW